jgi:polysaccharide pyruvyl transferase WcaK-like protein
VVEVNGGAGATVAVGSARAASLAGWRRDLDRVLEAWRGAPGWSPGGPATTGDPGRLLVVPPAAPGSLGDQAYVEGALRLARQEGWSPELVVHERCPDWAFPDGATGCRPVVHHRVPLHVSARAVPAADELLSTLRPQDAVMVLGADAACGAYGDDMLVALLYAGEAARRGLRAGVVSAGFDSHPAATFQEVLGALPPSVAIVLRDEDAFARASGWLHRPLALGADLAYAVPLRDDATVPAVVSRFLRRARERGRPVVALSVHSLLVDVSPYAQAQPKALGALLADVTRVIVHLVRLGSEVLLLPHDRRGRHSDEALAQALLSGLPDAVAAHVLDAGRLTVTASRRVAAAVDVVVSGRMHLAISCLIAGIPVVCVTYQDKFGALLRGAGLDGLALTPRELRDPEVVGGAVARALLTRGSLRRTMARHVATSRARTSHNMDFLRGRRMGGGGDGPCRSQS